MGKITKKNKLVEKMEKFSPEKTLPEQLEMPNISSSEQIRAENSDGSESDQGSPKGPRAEEEEEDNNSERTTKV